MTSAEIAELKALRMRFDGKDKDDLIHAEVARLTELEFKADDELGAAIARNGYAPECSAPTGRDWYICPCGDWAWGANYAAPGNTCDKTIVHHPRRAK